MSDSGILISTYEQTIHGGTYVAPVDPYYNVATINVMSIFQSGNTDAYNDIRVTKYSNRFLTVPTTPVGQAWKPDGKSISLVTASGQLSTYKLNEAWNISTVNTSTQVIDYTHPVLGAYGTTITRDTILSGIAWDDVGSRAYLTGTVKDTIFQFKASASYNVANLEPESSDTVEIYSSYNTQNVRVTDQNGFSSVTTRGLYVSPDGLHMYVADAGTYDKVFQYDMSTPFYTNTATMVGNTNIVQQSTLASGLSFRDDGSQMYVLDQTRACIFQWNLGTAWQANTAQCIPKANNAQGWTLDTNSNATVFTNPLNSTTYTPQAISFSRDGYLMYAADQTADYIFTYNLAAPWNVSTASAWTSNRMYTKWIDDAITGISFQSDGGAIFMIGTTNKQVNKIWLNRAWDLSSTTRDTLNRAEYANHALRFSGNYKDTYPGTSETAITGIQWGDGGMKLYTLGTSTDKIIQWNATEAWNVATLTNSGKSISTLLGDTAMSDFWIRDGGFFYTLAPTNRTVIAWQMSDWDISTATPVPAETNPNVTGIRYASKVANLTGMTGASFDISGDGTMLITLSGSTLYSYSLGTAWDISTASAVTSKTLTAAGFNVATPAAMCISGDGYNLYVLGTSLDRIYWFQMNPYDLTSITYSGISLLVSAQEGTGTGLFIEPGGSYLYLVGSASDRILKYNFGWGNDLSSCSYAGVGESLSITAFQATATGICFTPDGSRAVVSGGTSSTQVRQFDLSANPWLPSANSGATILSNTLQAAPTDIRYGDNGKKFYAISTSGIHQYDVWRDYQWNFNTVETTATGFYFHGEGSAWWLVGSANDRVYRFNMGSSWEINTTTYSGTSFLISAQSASSGGISFKSDGSQMYVSDSGTRYVYVYNLTNAWDISSGVSYSGLALNLSTATNMIEGTTGTTTSSLSGGGTCFTFNDYGTRCYSYGTASGTNVGYFALEYDFTRVINVAAQEATPQALFMHNDGSYACVIGNTNRRIFRYNFDWAWDLDYPVNYDSGASSAAISATVLSAITGLTVTNDGRSAYLIGTVAPASYLRRFTMPEGSEWNFSTMTLSYTNVATTEIGASPTDIYKTPDDDYRYYVSHGTLVKQFTMYRTFYVGSQDTAPTDFYLRDDRFYVMGTTNDRVYQYDLTSTWEIDSGNYTGNSFLVSSQEASATGLTFSNDGTRFIVTGTTNAFQYRLDEAWNITTSRYFTPNNTIALSTYSGLTGIQSIFLADNDKRFYVGGFGTTYNSVAEMKFCKHYYVGTQAAQPVDLAFQGQYWYGDSLFVLDNNTRKLFRYYTPNSFTIPDYNFDAQSPAYNSGETLGTSFMLSPDNYHYYVAGTTLDTIYQYDMTGPIDLATATTNKSFVNGSEAGMTSLAFASNGYKFWTTGTSATVKEYYLPASLYVGTQAALSHGLTFSAGGDYVYVYDVTTDAIKRYDCGSGYDIMTATYSQTSPSVNAQDPNFYAIDIQNSDNGSLWGWSAGRTVYLLGSNSIIRQYELPGSWDLTSGMSVGLSINISSFETSARGLRFSWDGYDIFVVGRTTSGAAPTVWRIPFNYARGTGYDHLVYWMTYYNINNRTSVTLQQGGLSNNLTDPTGISFSLDGTSMQVSDFSTGIYQYSLSRPWDITTATFKLHYNLSWAGVAIQDIYMSYYGNRFFTIDSTTDRINEFTIGPV